ncbi:MAG TPA: M35 family metallo-endopeptidase [Burkholderiaceae bacterium]
MPRFSTRILAAALLTAVTLAQAAPKQTLDVRLTVPTPVLRGDVDVTVTVTVTNTARHPVNLLKWQLPGDELEGPLFRVTRDDQKVDYLGPLVKRAAPGANDKVKLQPGESLSFQAELTGAYDLSQSGRYAIEYLSRGKRDDDASLKSSAPLYVWLEGRSGKAPVKPAPPPPTGGPVGFSGNCSSSQQTMINSAFKEATLYSTNAKEYLARNVSQAGSRYVKWFGAVSHPGGWALAGKNFTAIEDAFKTKSVVVDCKCRKSNIYAYVYPTQPYKIYVCGAFWAAPTTGTDSKAGTLVHEMSHFDVVAGTEDYAYGQSAAADLAATNPANALDNADNHEYFAENTPAGN